MIDIDEIMKRMILHEGIKLKPYKCSAGYLTIGVGRNLVTNPLTPEEQKVVGDWSQGISREKALYLLRNDIKNVIRDCKNHIGFWKHLDCERQYALIDMCFNMGIKRLLGFKKMLSNMEIGDYRGAAKECRNSKYARDVGQRAFRIAYAIEKGEFDYD